MVFPETKFLLMVAAVVCAVAIIVMLYSFVKSYFFKNEPTPVADPEPAPSVTTSVSDLPGDDVSVTTATVTPTAASPVTITITAPGPTELVSLPEVVVVAPPSVSVVTPNDVTVFRIEDAKVKEDKWGVRNETGTTSTHKTQYQAEKAAIDLAKAAKSSVTVLGRNGEIRKRMTYFK